MDDDTRQTADDLVECLLPLKASVRAMFGGYCVYIDDKVVGLVCDGRVFVKPSKAETIISGFAEPAPAYPGAKDSWRLTEGMIRDDPDRVIDIFRATADALPARKRRKTA